MPKIDSLPNLLLTAFDLLLDALRFIRLSLQPRCALAAENLFLRKQLALYLERQVKPRRAMVATKLTLVLLSRLFAWREALTVVKPDTLIRWHGKGFRLFWRWKSKSRGRSRVPAQLQQLIVEMAHHNPTRSEERIAAELLLKPGIRISPRTVRRYMPPDKGPQRGALGETVAVHPEQLFLRHGPPLVLKRDNGSNLNHQAVDEVLARYLVIPLNSHPIIRLTTAGWNARYGN